MPTDNTPTNRRIAIFDLDGTLTRHDTYLAFLTHALLRRPSRWPRTPLLAWAVVMFKSGRRDNTWLKTYFLNTILGGLHRPTLARWSKTFCDRLQRRGLHRAGLAALEKHRGAGDRLVLATASLDIYVRDIADALGMDEVVCTLTQEIDGVLQGTLASANCYGQHKLDRITDLLGDCGAQVTAYSDHHSDLPLLLWAGDGVAVNPTPRLSRMAVMHRLRTTHWS